MSFIREKEIPPGSGNYYAYRVESYREDGKVRQNQTYLGKAGSEAAKEAKEEYDESSSDEELGATSESENSSDEIITAANGGEQYKFVRDTDREQPQKSLDLDDATLYTMGNKTKSRRVRVWEDEEHGYEAVIEEHNIENRGRHFSASIEKKSQVYRESKHGHQGDMTESTTSGQTIGLGTDGAYNLNEAIEKVKSVIKSGDY